MSDQTLSAPAFDPLALTRAAIVRRLSPAEASAGMGLGDELLGELPTTVDARVPEACQASCSPQSSGAIK